MAAHHHVIGKWRIQSLERTQLTLRTRSKRLARKTLCFSNSIERHDIVIGVFVNRYELGSCYPGNALPFVRCRHRIAHYRARAAVALRSESHRYPSHKHCGSTLTLSTWDESRTDFFARPHQRSPHDRPPARRSRGTGRCCRQKTVADRSASAGRTRLLLRTASR